MALVAMATYDTPDNQRSGLTRRTLESLANTVDWGRHRLVVVDNGSTDPATLAALEGMNGDDRAWCSGWWLPPGAVIRNAENRGTARAVNQAWQYRRSDEAALKCDNDFTVEQHGWLDMLEECVARDPTLGIVGLKRKDLEERPGHENPWYQSELLMLPHERGQRWLVVERVHHVMGTCQLYSPHLLAKIGFLYQSGKYALDDSDAAVRCKVAGFYSAFLCGVEIDHIDAGGTEHTEWKRQHAGEHFAAYQRTCAEYVAGTRPIYRGPDEE